MSGPGLDPAVEAALAGAVAAVDALRREDAWYAAQTHATLARYALEEGHEVAAAAEAVDTPLDDPPGAAGGRTTRAARSDALRDELGDLLLQVVLHARLASEVRGAGGTDRTDGFDLADVASSLTAKARRRHPHVFAPAGGPAPTVAELEAGWEAVKDAERAGRDPLDDLPATLPALVRAQKVLALAARSGVEPPSGAASDGIGAALLALAERARLSGLDAEGELRAAVHALEARTRPAGTSAPRTDRGA